MARIFISYSRVDIEITERLVDRLRRIFTHENVWYDDNLHGGDQWWLEIIRQIAACDVFIYLLSNESVTSPYCLAEFEEARRLQKRIITVQVRDRTRIPDELDDIQYVNMGTGINDDALARLAGSINKQATMARKLRPLWQPATPRPNVPKHEARSETNDAVDTPTLNVPVRTLAPKRRSLPIVALLGLGIALSVTAVYAFNLANQNQTVTPPPTTAIAQQPTDAPTLNNVQVAPSPPPDLSPTPAPTFAPTVDTASTERAQLFASLTALGVQAQDAAASATVDAENRAATALAGNAISEATGTAEALIHDAVNTATAVAIAIEQARIAETATRSAVDATGTQAIIDAYTDTPTPTHTPTYTATPTPTSTPTATLTPREAALTRARAGVSSNGEWTPYIEEFDGVPMAMVPVGCFMMGEGDEAHEQCFDEPFWIDVYEVTNAQFAEFGGGASESSYWTDSNRPRERITWFEARDFCENKRGDSVYLPTEPQWEYAARGVDNLLYPWGNTFEEGNVVYSENSNSQTANVGSRPDGVSWIGAFDLAGNVYEWVSTAYEEYPYDPDDGREDLDRTDISRALRGGSWLSPIHLTRSAIRIGYASALRPDLIGFRCAHTL